MSLHTWTYDINNLTELELDKLNYLNEKFKYETPQLDEDSLKYKQGVEALVKLQTEIARREKEGA